MAHNLSPEELAEFREIFNLVDRVRRLYTIQSLQHTHAVV